MTRSDNVDVSMTPGVGDVNSDRMTRPVGATDYLVAGSGLTGVE